MFDHVTLRVVLPALGIGFSGLDGERRARQEVTCGVELLLETVGGCPCAAFFGLDGGADEMPRRVELAVRPDLYDRYLQGPLQVPDALS